MLEPRVNERGLDRKKKPAPERNPPPRRRLSLKLRPALPTVAPPYSATQLAPVIV
jgi:hypothetical protein